MTTQHLPKEALVLGPDEGTHLHFLNHLATIKMAGETGSMSVVEFLAPRGFGPPLHNHRQEDELFVILDGKVSVRSGDTEGLAGPGSCVFLPSGRPHTFQILTETARMVTVTSRTGTPATFDRMVMELGVPTSNPGIPAPGPIDPDAVAATCARHDIDIVGPPPPPLP